MKPGLNRKSIYVAGPMRGLPLFNFPAFDAAAMRLTWEGWRVISPAELDRRHGFDPLELPTDWDWTKTPQGFDFRHAIERDLAAIQEVDAIYMLDGWQKSRGAKAEHATAEWLGLEIHYQTQPAAVSGDILEEALQITSGDRQASYGPPDQDFRRTADMWTALFRSMLQDGVAFEPFHVAQAMILLKMSRQLHQRKRDNWVDTAGYARCGAICDQAAQG